MPSFNVEFVLDVPAARLWASLKAGNSLFPKATPQIFASIETIEGVDEEPESVRLIKFGSAAPPGAFVKEKLVSIDTDNKVVHTAEVEGGHLAMGFTKWECTMKVVAEGDQKTKMLLSFEYEGEGPAVPVAIQQVQQGSEPTFQGYVAYLISNGLYAEA